MAGNPHFTGWYTASRHLTTQSLGAAKYECVGDESGDAFPTHLRTFQNGVLREEYKADLRARYANMKLP